MIYHVLSATICATVAALMFVANFAWSPLIGTGFALTALALLVEGLDLVSNSKAQTATPAAEVVVEKSSIQDEDLYRDVRFEGRTGSDLVDPRAHRFSDDELKQIIRNAQNALRDGRTQVPVRTSGHRA